MSGVMRVEQWLAERASHGHEVEEDGGERASGSTCSNHLRIYNQKQILIQFGPTE